MVHWPAGGWCCRLDSAGQISAHQNVPNHITCFWLECRLWFGASEGEFTMILVLPRAPSCNWCVLIVVQCSLQTGPHPVTCNCNNFTCCSKSTCRLKSVFQFSNWSFGQNQSWLPILEIPGNGEAAVQFLLVLKLTCTQPDQLITWLIQRPCNDQCRD